MREKLTTKLNEANEKLNKIETRIAILQQENFRQNNANQELTKDIEFYKQQNLLLTEESGLASQELQKRQNIIQTLEKELEQLKSEYQTTLTESQRTQIKSLEVDGKITNVDELLK